MRLSLTAKLTAALFGMSAVMVTLIVAWAGWALEARFSAYVGSAVLAGMDRTVAVLEQDYQAGGGWSGIHSHPELWAAALRASEPPRPSLPPDPGPPNARPMAGPGDWPPPPGGRFGDPSPPPGGRFGDPGPPPGGRFGDLGPPPGEPGELGPPPGFPHHGPHGDVTLVDASGRFVAGAPPHGYAARRAIVANGHTVGALVFAPARLPGDIEGAFIAEGARDLYFAGAVALALSALWAVLLARYILAPVRLVASGARRLAAGELSARIDTGRRDELGDLVDDFNKLAVALEAAEQSRRIWIADTSHELRTPLAVLRAQIEALQDGVHQAGAQSLGRLHDEVLRMARLVDDLHELARADSHALGLRLEPVQPGEIMAEVLSRFAPRCKAAGLALQTAPGPPGPAVAMADPDRLRQVFGNLVENAIRYTDAGGTIAVTEAHMADEIRVTLEDTAPGVPEGKLPRLFDRFFRVDGSRSRQTGGSGLGLAICRAIVEAHGGAISAAASPLGGLAVTVALPAARQPGR